MATLVLGAAGTSIGGLLGASGIGGVLGVGGAITPMMTLGRLGGTAAGAYIDYKYTIPALLPSPPTIEGPRSDDLPLQTASEGTPVKMLFGPEAYVAGFVAWVPEAIKEYEAVPV